MRETGIRVISAILLFIPLLRAATSTTVQNVNRQAFYFEENGGQAAGPIKFVARGANGAVLISDDGVRLRGRNGAEDIQLKLEGASAAGVRGIEELPGRVNYLIGDDPTQWHTNLRTYARVERRGVYPGIDLVYYGNERQLEYDLVVAAGADPGQIHLRFDAAGKLRLNAAGDLILETAAGEWRQLRPRVYQVAGGVRRDVAGEYTLIGANEVTFRLPAYDHSQALVIDPTLVFASYLGGNNSDAANAVAVDSSGNMYVTGSTSSTQFPFQSAYQSSLPGYTAVFVTKILPGTGMVYSTYIGGNNNDIGYGIAVDASGDAYVTGSTSSSNFPTVNAAQSTLGGASCCYGDAFIFKLAPAGNSLVFSTYVGGSSSDVGNAIALDSAGNAYITGSTESTDFPTLNAFQSKNSTTYYGTAFVVKLGPTGARLFSTYLGGSGSDIGNAIAADSTGVYVGGNTSSSDFPVANAMQSTLAQTYYNLGFVTKFNPSGSALIFSTYVGQDYGTAIKSLAVDSSGNIYLAGTGTPSSFPSVQSFGIDSNFIGKMLANGSAFAYWVKFGTGSSLNAIAIDSQGHPYVTGTTSSTSFYTSSPFQAALSGYQNAFVAKLNATGTSLVYSSFLGGNSETFGNAIAVDSQGSAYLAGTVYPPSTNPNFPTVSPTQANFGEGNTDAFVAKVTDSTPFIDSMSPTNAVAGGNAFTLTLSGGGFTSSTVVAWNGSPRTTTFSSATQITASITAADIANVGSATVSLVGSPAGSSLFLTFEITSSQNPLPFISAISPASGISAGSAFALTVTGGGFIPTSAVQWNGQNKTTAYINNNEVIAQILSSDLSATGNTPVTVFNPTPGGGSSNTVNFAVGINFSITSLSPTSAFAQGPGFTLTVNGKNFVNGAVVQWNGTSRTTTFVSSTQLTAQITNADIAAPYTAQVSVMIPGPAGGTTGTTPFTVSGNYPTPVLASVSPNTIVACSAGTLTITGSGFVPPNNNYYYGSTVSINTTSYYYYNTTVTDSNHISIAFSSGTFPSGQLYITVTNPTPGGGISNALLLNVNPAIPSISSISPNSATQGSGALTLNVYSGGCGNSANTVVQWNGSPRATTFTYSNNYNYLTAAITATDLLSPGTALVTLNTPPPGGGTSTPVNFVVNPSTSPVPSLSSIFPASTAAGASGFSIAVNGSGFTGNSVVRWNGSNRSTSIVSTTQLMAFITANDLATVGADQISVFTPTPGGGTSNSLTFTVLPQLNPAGGVIAGFVSAVPGGTTQVPITLTLNSGVTIDSIAVGVAIVPTSGAPALTGSLSFQQGSTMPAANTVDTSGGPGLLSVYWTGIGTPLSGTVTLGNVGVTLPAVGSGGQTYQVQITAANASLASTPLSLNVGTGAITVAPDYGVDDVFPATSNAAGTFGDGTINTLDLISILRAVTNLPGFRPPACSDLFDAMDGYPADTSTARGGDGFLNTLDLIMALQRITNLNTTRPRRLSRNLTCASATSTPAELKRRLPNGDAILRLELAAASEQRTPVYLVATESVDLAGLTFAASGEGIAFIPVSQPSLADTGVANTVALAWLNNLSMQAGQTLLLGYLQSPTTPVVSGAAASAISGDSIEVDTPPGSRVRK